MTRRSLCPLRPFKSFLCQCLETRDGLMISLCPCGFIPYGCTLALPLPPGRAGLLLPGFVPRLDFYFLQWRLLPLRFSSGSMTVLGWEHIQHTCRSPPSFSSGRMLPPRRSIMVVGAMALPLISAAVFVSLKVHAKGQVKYKPDGPVRASFMHVFP